MIKLHADGRQEGSSSNARRGAAGLWLLAGFGTVVTALLTVAGFLGDFAWWLDLWTHFRVQYFLASVACVAVLLVARNWRLATLAVAVGAVNAWSVSPQIFQESPIAKAGAAGRALTVVTFNVQYSNNRYAELREFLRRERPDIAILQEINARWREELEELAADFPFRFIRDHEDWQGLAVLARMPWEEIEFIDQLNGTAAAVVRVRARHGDVVFTLLGTKTLPPRNAAWAASRDQQLAGLGALAGGVEGPVIVAGDFNATPWSRGYAVLQKQAGLRLAAGGHTPSWPSWLGSLGIPIDHVIVSQPLQIRRQAAGPYLGSDHRALIVAIDQVP